jgi:hypothetical protein
MNDTSDILTRAREAGAKAGMIDPSDLDRYIDDSVKVDGLGDVISKLREAKPYLFKPLLDLERIDEQLAAIEHKQADDQITRFVASKPGDKDLLKAIETGDFRC